MGLFASENILADVDGSDDHVPEMAMGFLPADDAVGLGVMIDKIIAYEPPGGPAESGSVDGGQS